MPNDDDKDGRSVRVLDETSGYGFTYWETSRATWEGKHAQKWEAAQRYFEAHPEPKPWEEAALDEIWELTDAEGITQLWVKTWETDWRNVHTQKTTKYNDMRVTAGRRIWPEEGSTK